MNPFKGVFAGIVAQMTERQVRQSWAFADRNEKKERLSAVSKLCIELDKVKQQTIQATRLAEMVIEHIIEGDWERAAEGAEDFTFEHEGEDHRAQFAPIYADFVTTCRTIFAEHARRDPNRRPDPH